LSRANAKKIYFQPLDIYFVLLYNKTAEDSNRRR